MHEVEEIKRLSLCEWCRFSFRKITHAHLFISLCSQYILRSWCDKNKDAINRITISGISNRQADYVRTVEPGLFIVQLFTKCAGKLFQVTLPVTEII